MYIDYTPEQKALRDELKAYFSQLITPEIREKIRNNEGGGLSGEIYKQIIRQMAKDNWLAVGWPKEYGGQGLSAMEQLIFFQEARLAGAPIPFVTLNTVGPALMEHGSEAHKAKFLPGIASGKTHFAIGYSEPGAGTDLASLKTSAVRDGDDYVINGTKVFTSGAEGADYIWLAVRTDADAPKHKGISIFIVDTKAPGFSLAPIETVGDVRTNMTYYDNVRVPADMLVGELNSGWRLITSQLNHERVGLAAFSVYGQGLFDQVQRWAAETNITNNEQKIGEVPWVQSTLAEAHCRLDAMRLMNARMAEAMDQGHVDPAFASAIKVYSTECLIEVYRLLLEVVGGNGLLKRDSVGAVVHGELEQEYRQCQINTFGGGVNEVQRDLIARFGLKMVAGR